MLTKILKMVYQLILVCFTLISFSINVFFVFCNLLIPLAFLAILGTLLFSKFWRLPEPQTAERFFKFDKDEELEFPIANK